MPQDKPVLNIAVLCCDVPAGRRALRALANLANQEEPAIHVQPSVWSADSLDNANIGRVVDEAVAADHIVVASTDRRLPRIAEQWLVQVLAKRQRETRVLGLWGDCDEWITLKVQDSAGLGAGAPSSAAIRAAA